MASELGILFFLLTVVKATLIEIQQEWKPNFGWEVTCSWDMYEDKSMRSVSLSKNEQQFFKFSPEDEYNIRHQTDFWRSPGSLMKVDCLQTVDRGMKGKCVLTIEPKRPPERDFTYGCEVSGQYFMIDHKELLVEAFLPPSNAVIRAITPNFGPVTLNCTSSGIPAPSLIWTVDDQQVTHKFPGSAVWNATSKLWDVWSSFTPQSDAFHKVQCTPEALKSGLTTRGLSSQYNNAYRSYRIFLDGTILIISAVATLLL